MNNEQQRIENPNAEEVRKKWIEKRKRQQVLNQTVNLHTRLQRDFNSEPALMSIIENVAQNGGAGSLIKLQQMIASYLQIANNNGEF